jgi:DNA-binding transcriptional regulator YdaS (Cro superfamily)
MSTFIAQNAWSGLRNNVNRSDIAKALGITTQAISQWKRVPAERVSQVSEATGIPVQDLRPDLFLSKAVSS